MAAILMTSLLGPDAELRWANWLKLLKIQKSLILYRSPKIVTKFTRNNFFGPFDIDYKSPYIFVTLQGEFGPRAPPPPISIRA